MTKRLTSDMKYGSLGGIPDVTAAASYGQTTDGMRLIKLLIKYIFYRHRKEINNGDFNGEYYHHLKSKSFYSFTFLTIMVYSISN